ncbi:MAG: DEAD/DEAH box helicase family protein [Acidimicrobiaceae bacterium]|nr:DEAD/DEAH box helicase family protein [Acidimicrobiaceae bacterium]
MQREAVSLAVERLRANELADEDNIPRGEARGRIVLPCGTGKTRIALRITEELTYPGDLSVVLCPSIALVAQIRREFLQHAESPLRVMAVCSDPGVAADEEGVVNKDDPTLDRGMATTEEIKGCLVTTDPDEIADWIDQRRSTTAGEAMSVIFGTYQSAARIAEAIAKAGAADAFKVLICDEAHRTAGVRRRKRATAEEQRLREFTLCHDREAFPATYRIYQTATPKIYGDNATAAAVGRADRGDFVIRQMDDQSVFGVELYRRSYADAVRNGWLSDYRIIAMAVGGEEATGIANQLVREADSLAALEAEQQTTARAGGRAKSPRGRADRLPTTGDYLKGIGFALAMGGAVKDPSGSRVPLRSCIGFVNTINRSLAMTQVLQSESVREWVAKQAGHPAPHYRLEHLDASSPVAARDEAKRRLAAGDDQAPHGVLNVGIFGEGTDSPSLSAVAFLEPRKSPIDVVQAVGRAMRRAEGKSLGYIVVPVVIPPGVDAEEHLAVSDKHEGWRELGDILQALRAHDKRIEDALPEMLSIQLPADPPLELELQTVIAVGRPEATRLEYAVINGSRERAIETVQAAVKLQRPLLDFEDTQPFDEETLQRVDYEPDSVIVHVERPDGSFETRQDSVVRHKPGRNEARGRINAPQTKRRTTKTANGERGRVLPSATERARRRAALDATRQAAFEGHVQETLDGITTTIGSDVAMNLLEKSGLTGNQVRRDLNLLADAVGEAARNLHDEAGLATELDKYFMLDQLAAPKQGKPRADGATIASLLWMNAAMLQQRIHAGNWLSLQNIDSLREIKASPEPEELLRESWNAITRQDFLPVLEPALGALRCARRTGRLGGLRRALRHLANEAEQIAATYADMGTDHAGALFNKVMGDQASDGAFFTRPVAADIAARLALEAVDPNNSLAWSDAAVWREHKTVDLACGSGTLLTAVMTEMKRRAVERGANPDGVANLQKLAVEEVFKGLDINAVSLQLAATQLMSGNTDITYRKMGLHLMPYGRQSDGSVSAGTPELFARSEIVDANRLFDDAAESSTILTGAERQRRSGAPEMDDATAAVHDARIVIMNPPFTNRTKMGEKFDKPTQQALRGRMDVLEGLLATADRPLSEFLDKNSLRPRFAALADLCLDRDCGVFATVIPTTALTNPSGLPERLELARRFAVHTILTCHQVGNINLSQNTNINESIVVLHRQPSGEHRPTRIIALDRLPSDDADVDQLFKHIATHPTGELGDGWGEVSLWPAERIQAGDWTAAVWRSPALASAAADFATHPDLATIGGGGPAQNPGQPNRPPTQGKPPVWGGYPPFETI